MGSWRPRNKCPDRVDLRAFGNSAESPRTCAANVRHACAGMLSVTPCRSCESRIITASVDATSTQFPFSAL
jgi:hypothetical protein